MRQFFSQSMCIYLALHVDISILVIQLFRSASSCSCSKDGLFSDKICNSLWLVNQLATFKCLHNNRLKAVLHGFVFSEDLPRHLWGASLLWRLPDPIIHSFQRLISCKLTTFSNETLIAWVRPFPSQLQLQHWSDIESDWCCGTSPACETKPTVCKLSKSRCSPI